jgi:hypothetical protein
MYEHFCTDAVIDNIVGMNKVQKIIIVGSAVRDIFDSSDIFIEDSEYLN